MAAGYRDHALISTHILEVVDASLHARSSSRRQDRRGMKKSLRHSRRARRSPQRRETLGLARQRSAGARARHHRVCAPPQVAAGSNLRDVELLCDCRNPGGPPPLTGDPAPARGQPVDQRNCISNRAGSTKCFRAVTQGAWWRNCRIPARAQPVTLRSRSHTSSSSFSCCSLASSRSISFGFTTSAVRRISRRSSISTLSHLFLIPRFRCACDRGANSTISC